MDGGEGHDVGAELGDDATRLQQGEIQREKKTPPLRVALLLLMKLGPEERAVAFEARADEMVNLALKQEVHLERVAGACVLEGWHGLGQGSHGDWQSVVFLEIVLVSVEQEETLQMEDWAESMHCQTSPS